MSDVETVFNSLAVRQHGVAAVWQLLRKKLERKAIEHWVRTRRPPRVHRGVYGEPSSLGCFMAAALALGPGAAVSHLSALRVWGMRPHEVDEPKDDVDVSAPGPGGRCERKGMVVHRRMDLRRTRCLEIPVTTPTQSLIDAGLLRHERTGRWRPRRCCG